MKITTAFEQVVDAALHIVAPSYARDRTEQPTYEVVIDDEPFQLRRYAPMLVAAVTVTGERSEATDEAFGQLASYIFGTDREGEEIAMTTPVTQAVGDVTDAIAVDEEEVAAQASSESAPTPHGADPMVTVSGDPSQEGRYTVRFAMPARFTLETLPASTNPNIVIGVLAEREMAVVTFSGAASDESVREAEERLRGFLERRSLMPDGSLEYAYYDPPFTLPPLRRNEVMMGVIGVV